MKQHFELLILQPKMTDVDGHQASDQSVLDQTESMHKAGTIWSDVLKADREAIGLQIATNQDILKTRGGVGECPIHMLFLYGSDAHLDIARELLTEYPDLAEQFYNEKLYYGENILHIAIVKQQVKMIRWLFETDELKPYHKSLLEARATGDFFKLGKPSYYGETPLGFACCTNQWEIVEILLENGADMDAVDSYGNNILHVLVINDLEDMYDKFKERWIERKENNSMKEKLWNRVNKEHFTPLTLAAHYGRPKLLLSLIEKRKKVLWTYGAVTCLLHPLDQLDLDLDTQNNTERLSVLDVIIRNNNAKLINPIIIALVEEKWKSFAERILRRRFFMTFFYLITFLFTTILEQMESFKDNEESDLKKMNFSQISYRGLCLTGNLILIIGALWKAGREIGEMCTLGLRDYFGSSGSVFLENILSFSFCVSILVARMLHFFLSESATLVLAFASLLGWAYMLFFTMPFRFTGPFVIMISKMLFNDVLRFCIIYTVFLFGFSQAFFILFNNDGLYGFLSSVKHCFLGMLGDFDLDHHIDSPFPITTVSLLIFYVVLITILLLNLLIAMMGDTFADVKSSAKQLWHLERTRIALDIERNLSQEERALTKNRYWVDIEGERYFQVERVNSKLFRSKDQKHDDDDDDENDEKNDEKE